MAAPSVPWATNGEPAAGFGAVQDIINRALRYILQKSGIDVDVVGFFGLVSVFNVCAYGAVGDGTTNCNIAVQNAVNDAMVAGGTVFFPKGTYLLTTTITIGSHGVIIRGAGRRASFIKFNPASPAICLDWINSSAATTLGNCGLSDIAAISTNAVQKTWCCFTDISEFDYDRVMVYSSWTSTGLDSIGMLHKGRELFRANTYTLFCDRPVVFQQNPRDSTTFIDMDFYTFRDGYTCAATTRYNFELASNLRSVQHPRFDGLAMVGGLGCFSWNGVGATRDSQGWVLKDCRSEQMTSGGWFVDFSRDAFTIVGPQFINCAPSFGNDGFRLRRTTQARFSTIEWPDTTGTKVLFDFDGTNSKLSWVNVWTQVGGAVNITGLVLTRGVTRFAFVDLAIPTAAEYDIPSAGAAMYGGNILMTSNGTRRYLRFTSGSIDTYQNDTTTLAHREYFTGRQVHPQGITIGADGTGTILTQIRVYTPTITPASVAAQTVAEQTFSVPGLTTSDTVEVNPAAIANAIGIVGWRVSAADTLAVRFVNPTAGALTPTAGTWRVKATRS